MLKRNQRLFAIIGFGFLVLVLNSGARADFKVWYEKAPFPGVFSQENNQASRWTSISCPYVLFGTGDDTVFYKFKQMDLCEEVKVKVKAGVEVNGTLEPVYTKENPIFLDADQNRNINAAGL